jgi:predicted dehydrogenase
VESRDETTLTLSLIGKQPEVRTYPQVDSLAVLLEAFTETIETGKPFPVSAADMLDVVGTFEAIVRSIGEGKPVKVAR